ncbi:hypothetical protein ABW19_dt0206239 [Dactylella cylindrospora]|nr:hypothetical protein ABW19_dt0206239 [Dactylella cylindrospora]
MASPRVFILPSGKGGENSLKPSHTILSLKHPNTGVSTRYLLHHPPSPQENDPFLYEILKIANPSYDPRSWLITPDVPPLKIPTEPAKEGAGSAKADEEPAETEGQDDEKKDEKASYVIKDAHLFLTTPIDPLYLLLSHITSDKVSRKFLSFDDLLEDHPEYSIWSRIFKLHPPSQAALQTRLLAVCDTVPAGDETMYRVNTKKLYDTLISRVEATAKSLPPSLIKFINRKLSKPIGLQVTTWKRQTQVDNSGGIIDDAELEDEVLQETGDGQDAVDSQLRREASRLNLNKEDSTVSQLEDTNTGTSTPAGETETTVAQVPQEDLLPSTEIQYLARLTHAVQFMQSYLPPALYTKLSEELYSRFPLGPLESYQEEVKSLRAAATAAMDMSISYTKRTIEDMEGGVTKEDAAREKKRKKKEEDLKKSSGVKKLEKVDTKGMMKMTSFFKKKES